MADTNPMKGVIPYLAMNDRAGEACDFYAAAFGAEDKGRMPRPDGQAGFLHVQVLINGGMLMLTDHWTEKTPPSTGFGHLQLVVEDGSAWWERAIAAGCTAIAPYERQFWGDDWGLLEDPFGIKWAILQANEQPARDADKTGAEVAA